MMTNNNRNEYDQAATVFSPDGRVYQVEYAREAIKRGGLAMGIKFRGGVVFSIDKTIHSSLVEEDELQKFYRITGSVGAAASGLIADARVLADLLREISQDEYKKYGENVDIKHLVGRVSRIYEIYTRYEGVRPFGAALIIGGKDSTGYRLYETDPSGVFQERGATAIGTGSDAALTVLEEKYRPDMKRDEALMLICSLLKSAMAARPVEETSDIEVHIITDDGFELIEVDRERLLKSTPEDFCPRKRARQSPDLPALLDTVPKLPDKAKALIVERFQTVDDLKKATMYDLTAVPGIGKATAQRILKALNG
jgi:proteasome alpha subunit